MLEVEHFQQEPPAPTPESRDIELEREPWRPPHRFRNIQKLYSLGIPRTTRQYPGTSGRATLPPADSPDHSTTILGAGTTTTVGTAGGRESTSAVRDDASRWKRGGPAPRGAEEELHLGKGADRSTSGGGMGKTPLGVADESFFFPKNDSGGDHFSGISGSLAESSSYVVDPRSLVKQSFSSSTGGRGPTTRDYRAGGGPPVSSRGGLGGSSTRSTTGAAAPGGIKRSCTEMTTSAADHHGGRSSFLLRAGGPRGRCGGDPHPRLTGCSSAS